MRSVLTRNLLDSHGSFASPTSLALSPFGKASPFSRVASMLRVSSPRQLDFPDLHATSREIMQGMFPDIPTAFTHDHALPDALALAMDFHLSNVCFFRKLTWSQLLTPFVDCRFERQSSTAS